MTERDQLELAIAALENQRAILGDATVDTALAPMRGRLVAIAAEAAVASCAPSAEQRRKQVTVLFADVSGFTAMSETLDAEDVAEIMNGLWARLDAAVARNGGRIDKHIGDAIMALWGTDAGREDDPERAIRAALSMQAELAALREERGSLLSMRIGLNTGPVVLGEMGSTHEFTAMGDTVNLASRLESAAPLGGILVSHDSYRHVRGLFDVQPQDPLEVKGKAEPVRSYVVLGVKPRSFRTVTRGVEGIETRMVGRDAELAKLEESCLASLREGELRISTVAGPAGSGKSRLLFEFKEWCELRPERMRVLKGRASPEMRGIPNSLMRDVFSFRLGIQDTDSRASVREKMEKGISFAYGIAEGGTLPTDILMRAHFIGQLLGFDFSDSPHISGILGDPKQIRDRALAYLTQLFKQLVTQGQVNLLLLEDLHWADESSLYFIGRLAKACAKERFLIVCTSRPELFERHADWGKDLPRHERIELRPLSREESRALVGEILKRVPTLPDALRAMVVDNAEGNPFYVEELIKMLIDDGVILRSKEIWKVDPTRLAEIRVPPTLTAVLQARFDALPGAERAVLQRASVLGRTFWAEAADAISAAPLLEETTAALAALGSREMVFGREVSTFAGTAEYIFKHALMRDATYESVLKKDRKEYHARAADWLIAASGERAAEFGALIAEHLQRAGKAAEAAELWCRAGERARGTGEYRQALHCFERVFASMSQDDPKHRELLVRTGEALFRIGDFAEARRRLRLCLDSGAGIDPPVVRIEAHMCLSWIAVTVGDFDLARSEAEAALAEPREGVPPSIIVRAMNALSGVAFYRGKIDEALALQTECLERSRTTGDKPGIARALSNMGSFLRLSERKDEAEAMLIEGLGLCRELGDRMGEAVVLGTLGGLNYARGDRKTCGGFLLESLRIARGTENQMLVISNLSDLGEISIALGDEVAARLYCGEGLSLASELHILPYILALLVHTAGLFELQGRGERSAELVGLVEKHPALHAETRQTEIVPLLARLRERLGAKALEAAMERGRAVELDKVVAELLGAELSGSFTEKREHEEGP